LPILSPLRVWLPLCVGTALPRQSGNALTPRKDCDAGFAKAFTMSDPAAPAVHRTRGAKVRPVAAMAGRWPSSNFPLGAQVRASRGFVPITSALVPRDDADR